MLISLPVRPPICPIALDAADPALLSDDPADEVTLVSPCEALDVACEAPSCALVAPDDAALAASDVVEA